VQWLFSAQRFRSDRLIFLTVAPEQDEGQSFCEEEQVPKIKTHKIAAKRFKYTGSGKLMRTKVGKSHFRRKKSKRVKGMYDEMFEVTSPGTKRRIRKLVPYLKK
jgi:large subunit ribosomal protein L35